MFNVIPAAPAFQAKTARIKPQAEEEITLMIQAYPGAPVVSVCKSFYGRIRDQIQAQIPNLKRGKKYTAKKLCTSNFWGQMAKADQLAAGKCVAYMVTRRDLPLLAADKNTSNACLYELP